MVQITDFNLSGDAAPKFDDLPVFTQKWVKAALALAKKPLEEALAGRKLLDDYDVDTSWDRWSFMDVAEQAQDGGFGWDLLEGAAKRVSDTIEISFAELMTLMPFMRNTNEFDFDRISLDEKDLTSSEILAKGVELVLHAAVREKGLHLITDLLIEEAAKRDGSLDREALLGGTTPNEGAAGPARPK